MGSVQRRRAEFTFKSRPQLDSLLTTLDQDLPQLLKQYPDPDDFWPHYAAVTDKLLSATGAEDDRYVCMRLDDILSAHGLAPPDDIDQSCYSTHADDSGIRAPN